MAGPALAAGPTLAAGPALAAGPEVDAGGAGPCATGAAEVPTAPQPQITRPPVARPAAPARTRNPPHLRPAPPRSAADHGPPRRGRRGQRCRARAADSAPRPR